jgi:hypothetical protein
MPVRFTVPPHHRQSGLVSPSDEVAARTGQIAEQLPQGRLVELHQIQG